MFEALGKRFGALKVALFGDRSPKDNHNNTADQTYQGSSTVQEFIERHFAHEDVSNRCWRLLWQTAFVGFSLAATGIYGSLFWRISLWTGALYILCLVAGIALLGGARYVAVSCKVTVPSYPKSVGVLNIWNKRQRVLLQPGDKLLFSFSPFNMTATIEDVTPVTFEFEFADVMCAGSPDPLAAVGTSVPKTGGEVLIQVAMRAVPDTSSYERYDLFINLGWAKIEKQLRWTTSQGVKNVAIRYGYETVLSLGKALSIMLLVQISEVDFHELPMDSQGAIDPQLLESLTLEKYEKYPRIVDPVTYLSPVPDNSTGQQTNPVTTRAQEQQIAAFQDVAKFKDLADIMNLGIRIGNLNVPKIKQDEALNEASEEAAAQNKRSESDRRRTEARVANAMIMVNASKPSPDGEPTIPLPEALQILRIEDERASEIVLRGAGSELTAGAAIYAATNKKNTQHVK